MAKFHVPANLMRVELDAIKKKQKERKEEKPEKITNELLYGMLSDVLENQARIMNYMEKGKFN